MFGNVLGKGNYGVVYMAHTSESEKYTIKVCLEEIDE